MNSIKIFPTLTQRYSDLGNQTNFFSKNMLTDFSRVIKAQKDAYVKASLSLLIVIRDS